METDSSVAMLDHRHVTLASLTSLSLQKFTGKKLDDDNMMDQFLWEFERHALPAG